MSEEREGVDAEPELRAHRKANVDPTGHVSSGVQTGPLRTADQAPVASTDEAVRGDRPGVSPGKVGPKGAQPADDITERYRVEEGEGS